MPITLPAHPAAILPFCRHLPVVPLVIGACAPDIAYVIGKWAKVSHSWPGVLTFCVPAGLLALLWTESLLLPHLAPRLPRVLGVEWSRFARAGLRPTRDARAWLLVMVALALGAATHVLWDGFTHRRMWPARDLYAGVFVAPHWPLTRVLQHSSTLAGTALIALSLRSAYPRLPSGGVGARAHRAAIWPTVLATAIGIAGGFAVRFAVGWRAGSTISLLWRFFWPGVGGAIFALTVVSLLALLRPLPLTSGSEE